MKVRRDISKITMYKTDWCSDCIRADHFFEEYNIIPESINIDDNETAALEVIKINNGNRSVPTIVIEFEKNDNMILVEPSRDTLENTFLIQPK
jgi:mycoredoxin